MNSENSSEPETVLDKIEIFDDFIDIDTVDKMYKKILNSNWVIHHSHAALKDNLIFAHDLISDKYFTETLFEKVLSKTGGDYKIDRVYANGQYFGMPGKPHSDSSRTENNESNCLTFLIYINPIWDFLWGGQTFFFNRYHIFSDGRCKTVILNDDTRVIYPIPGRAIVFPSEIMHYAESPSKDCFDFRITVAYKLKKIS